MKHGSFAIKLDTEEKAKVKEPKRAFISFAFFHLGLFTFVHFHFYLDFWVLCFI